jgi:D-xylose transport system substrate-binding protein
VQRIIAGEQYMTVYRPVRQEAEAAAQIAYDLAYGIAVAAALTGGNSVNNGSADLPAVLVQPVAVTRRTLLATVVADGFWTRADICTADYASACKAAGLS